MAAIKQLNRDGLQGCKEYLVEVLMLIMLQHPNLVTLIGYCAEGDERLLVYEYMAQCSLEDHLFGKHVDFFCILKCLLGNERTTVCSSGSILSPKTKCKNLTPTTLFFVMSANEKLTHLPAKFPRMEPRCKEI